MARGVKREPVSRDTASGTGREGRGESSRQGVIEPGVLRSLYRSVKNLINDESDNISGVDSDKFKSIINEVESLHEQVVNYNPSTLVEKHDSKECRRKKMRELLLTAAILAAGYYATYLEKRPCRTSIVNGASYVKEILGGHSARCREICRMERPVFKKLCDVIRSKALLHDTKGVEVEEQLMMFLFTIGQNASNRQVQERFQHSGETVSRHFNAVLDALMKLLSHYICLPSTNASPEFHDQSHLFPFFKDCIGAIAGIHIPVSVDVEKQMAYRNQYGFLSQNVMVACSFDLRFLFVLAGLEGSIANSTVLQAALQSGFYVPQGKYYLVDAGYANTPNFIAPYSGVRYHLKEFAHGNQAPQNAKELFNHCHASLRNKIECIFDILKRRFPLLKAAPSYSIKSQIKLVHVMCMLHNFISIETGGDDWIYEDCNEEIQNQLSQHEDHEEFQCSLDATTDSQQQLAIMLRDDIANEMWEDYCTH